jgi:rare lipoprotein A (peptidoglycan hydrolase)
MNPSNFSACSVLLSEDQFLEEHVRNVVGMGFMAAFLLVGTAASGLAQDSVRHVPHKQVGKASIYSTRLQGRTMTNGEPLNVRSDAAASKTLPIGTKAQVTNLETGKTAPITIKDRGPVPHSRIVDLTPHTANQIGLTKKEGVAPVAVVPTNVPPRATESAAARP